MNLAHVLRQLNLRRWLQRSSGLWEEHTRVDEWPLPEGHTTAYRLKKWPHINNRMKRVGSYRALSLLSHEPVAFDKLSKCMHGSTLETVELLKFLEGQNALEIVEMQWQPSAQSLQDSLGARWVH
jgi:hypothetical protein